MDVHKNEFEYLGQGKDSPRRRSAKSKMDPLMDQRNHSDGKSTRLSSENSSNGNKCLNHKVNGSPIKRNQNGIISVNSGEEGLRECCKRKRYNCDNGENKNCMYKFQGSSLQCIGILPGLGTFTDSSDSDDSGSTDAEDNVDRDLLGRKVVYESKQQQQQQESR